MAAFTETGFAVQGIVSKRAGDAGPLRKEREVSNKLAIIDIDETLVHTDARFARARQVMTELFAEHVTDTSVKMKHVMKMAEEEFWRVGFDPGLICLDDPIPGAEDALYRIEDAGYQIVLLSSRIEALREATVEYFFKYQPAIYDLIYYHGGLFLKPTAFQHVKTAVWKAGITQMLAAQYDAEEVLFVDDDKENCESVLQHAGTYPLVRVALSLDAAVELLYPGVKEKVSE